MNLENLIAVSGLPGLYRMAANRSNGLIIEDLKTGKRRFASSRKHQFTPLESIAIYTDDGDSTELKNVFQSMYQKLEATPPLSANASTDELHDYFAAILPNYDRDRVFTGDIKKVIKWFTFLNESGALSEAAAVTAIAGEEEE
ncbi:MAG: DUF5606 domain-containing protein [Phaeodactylibacter sp.]|nr:DUF5606 domain-containing protein [Phaeodactylibacter sp.]MCB9275079.1 DUF5606 domain-containing protein [Lewinellaceae bacterium]